MGTRFNEEFSPETNLVDRVRDSIRWDKRINNADFQILADGNRVLVSGYVDSTFKKKAALEVISRTEGVWHIDDHIVVPLDYYRTDTEIEDILRRQIDEFVKVGGEFIDIDVVEGVVKLEGEVFRPRLKAMASAHAWELSGVRDVLNFINIKGSPQRMPLAFDYEIFGLFSSQDNAPSADAGQFKEVS